MVAVAKKQKIEAGSIEIRVLPESYEKAQRTFDVVLSTGAKVRRYDYFRQRTYYESLSLDPAHVRLDRLNSGRAPFCQDHRAYSIEGVIGTIVEGSVRLLGGEMIAKIRMHETERAIEITGRMERGELRNISLGYRTYEQVETRSKDEEEVYERLATDWEPNEASLVARGADDDSFVRDMEGGSMCLVRNETGEPMDPDELADQQGGTATTPSQGTDNTSRSVDDGSSAAAPSPAPKVETQVVGSGEQTRQADLDAAAERGAEAEADRRDQIRSAVTSAGLESDFAETLIKDKKGIDAARALIIDKIAETRGGDEVASQTRAQVTEEEHEKYYGAIERSLLARHDSRKFKIEDGDDAGQLRGFSLMELGTQVLQRSVGGQALPGDPNTRAKLIMGGRAGLRGMHTSSDFPSILANVANKTLRGGYAMARRAHGPLVRERSASDFKEITNVQLGAASKVEEVAEGGEYTYGTIGEAKEPYRVKKYGKILAFTREMIINDDVDAFTRVPALMGAQCARNESTVFWSIFRDNPLMHDGLPLFHVDHGNVIDGPLDAEGLNAAMIAMGLQTDLDGETELEIMPEFILTPLALKVAAEKLLVLRTLPTTDSETNPFKGELEPISTQFLDKNSTDEWFMSASPSMVDTIEVAYLGGNREPFFDYQEGFDVDGTKIKVRHEFGMKAIDWRGLVKATGV